MTDFRSKTSLGERIKFLRKSRGIKSTNELSELTGGAVSAWTLQNIESGRKPDLNISALLNLAMALRVAPTFLLAPMATPGGKLDLPDLMGDFADMSVTEFDAWFAGLPEGAVAMSGADRNERQELQALRELTSLLRERRRLETMSALESETFDVTDETARSFIASTSRRIAEADHHINELSTFLATAGWDLGEQAAGRA